jgi:hypothetical protein
MRLLENKIGELRTAYDKYFAGIERIEPTGLKNEVQRLVRRMSTLPITNTAVKFKRDNLIAQYNSYSLYWNKILRQIEDGTYSRDLFKMQLKERGITTPQRPRQEPPTPTPSSPGGKFNSVFKELVTTKKKLGENTNSMNYKTFEENLSKQSEAIKKKYKVSSVDFVVEEKSGKAVIKAVPKK